MPRRTARRGPLPPLPAPLDAAARWWAATDGRTRWFLRAVVTVVLLVAAGGGLRDGPWGAPVPVVVTTSAVPPGSLVESPVLTVAERPSSLVPVDALRTLDQVPPRATAAGPLHAGAVVTSSLLHAGGPTALATPGTAVVAIEVALLPPLPVGTIVDLAVPAFDGTATIVARSAEVIADDGTFRWVRVGREEVPALAAGLSGGRLVAAALPPARDGVP